MSDLPANRHDDLLDSLLGDFLDESDQLLVQLNERLLQLDEWVRALDGDHHEPCDPTVLNEMFRAAHSLKGLSAMLGLADINHLTHKIENVFDAARKNELAVTGNVTELVFMGLDQLAALINRLKEPAGEPVDCTAVVDAIRQLLQTAGVERKQSSQADADKFLSAETKAADAKPPSPPEPVPGMLATVARQESPSGSASPETAAADQASAADPLEDICDEGEIPQKYLSIFIDETETSLDKLTGALLALERGGKGDDLKSLMGTAHKIKGSAAAIGLNRIAKLAHLMEDVLQELIQTHGSLPVRVTDVLLKCSDALQRNVAALKQGTPRTDQFGQLAQELLAARSGSPAQEACGQTTETAAARTAVAVTDQLVPGTAQAKPIQAGEPRAAGGGQRPTETVRVDIDRLDHLMDLASQLVISRAQFAQIGDKFRNMLGCKHSGKP